MGNVWAFARNFAASIGAIAAAAVILWNIGGWIMAPRLAPALHSLETIPDILDRLGAIEDRLPPRRVIEFEGSGRATPLYAHAGDRIRVTYLVRRTSDCAVTVYERWHDIKHDALDAEFSRRRPAIGSPVVRYHQPRSVIIQIPPGLPSGEWAYAPIFEPDPATCPNPEHIIAPLAYVIVLPPEAPIPPLPYPAGP